MAITSKIGYPDVPKSITNPNVYLTNTLDKDSPMSFLEFIKIVSVSYEPDSLQSYYNHYLKLWNNQSKTKTTTDDELIRERYRDFLKDINLNYTSPEEKRFLSKIDFNDPYDIDLAVSFYGRKLKELARFYNRQRNEIKFSTIKNKMKCSNLGTEITIRELIISYLENYEDGKMLFDLEEIIPNVEVELQELYDTYPTYLNQTPDSTKFDNKDFDYGMNLFLTDDKTTIATNFSSFSQELQNLKEIDELLDNKRKLTQKYMATDWYYLSTGKTTTDIVSGKLFDNQNTIENFINREYPTTASTERNTNLQTFRERGFFKPHKMGIVLVDGLVDSYTINTSYLTPNNLYLYPDPDKIGTTGEVFLYTFDDSFLKKNFSSGNAVGEPISTPNDTKYYGYVSKLDQNAKKYLDVIFDSGHIQDYKKDVFGNSWGLFKNDHRYRKTIDNDADDRVINYLTIYGGELYEPVNDSKSFNISLSTNLVSLTGNFLCSEVTIYNINKPSILVYDTNYSNDDNGFLLEQMDSITLRGLTNTDQVSAKSLSGETTIYYRAQEFSSSFQPLPITIPSLTSTIFDATLFFGFLKRPDFPQSYEYETLEGAIIVDKYGNSLVETYSTDLDIFEDSFEGGIDLYYYSDLYDGGIYSRNPLVRATSSLSADATIMNRTSAVEIVDGGSVGDGFDNYLSISKDTYYYDDTVFQTSQYTLSTIPEEVGWELNGKIFIRNPKTQEVKELLEAIPHLSTKYETGVVEELENHVINFEITSNVVIIETKTYLVIFKLSFVDGEFIDSKETYHIVEHNSYEANDHNITNRFKVNNKIYYVKLLWGNPNQNNNLVIFPSIYEYDIPTNKNNLIYTTLQGDTEFLSISSNDVYYENLHSPKLSYSSMNNIFSFSFLFKDQNDYPTLHTFDFDLKPDVNWLDHKVYKFGGVSFTNTLSSIDTFNVFLDSGDVSFSDTTLII